MYKRQGGIPPHLTDGAAVGFAQVGNRFLQQMLQEALLVDVDLVELVDVDAVSYTHLDVYKRQE